MVMQREDLKNSYSRVTIGNRQDFKGILLSPKSRFFSKNIPSFMDKAIKGSAEKKVQVVTSATPEYYKVRKPSSNPGTSTRSTAVPRFNSIGVSGTPDAAAGNKRPNTAGLYNRHYSRNSGATAQRFGSVTIDHQLLVEVPTHQNLQATRTRTPNLTA